MREVIFCLLAYNNMIFAIHERTPHLHNCIMAEIITNVINKFSNYQKLHYSCLSVHIHQGLSLVSYDLQTTKTQSDCRFYLKPLCLFWESILFQRKT